MTSISKACRKCKKKYKVDINAIEEEVKAKMIQAEKDLQKQIEDCKHDDSDK